MRIFFLGLICALPFVLTEQSDLHSKPVLQNSHYALTHVTLMTPNLAEPIPDATIIIKAGKIVRVGAKLPVPPDAEEINLTGKTVIPGLVDTHSHIGIYPKPRVPAHSDGNEMSGPVQPAIRALDAIDPNDLGIKMAVAGGITTANIMPGSGNVIGGSTVYVKLRGSSIEEMQLFGKDQDRTILGGLKMANGENPKGYGRGKQQAPFTRMKVAALQREQFVKAREYQEKLKGAEKPDRDLAMEQLVEVLERKRTVHFHCHRADDILTATRIAEEFGFELVLQHATEGYRIAEILAKKQIPVSLTLLDSPGGKAEAVGLLEENAAVLEKAGVAVTINTDDFVTESRFFLRTGAIAVRGGMSEMSALKALTLTPAKLMHLDHRIGSLDAGKDADFVVLSGSPFSVYTRVEQTWIDGIKRFDAADEAQRSYRDGGFLLARGTPLPAAQPLVKPLEEPEQTFFVLPELPQKPKRLVVCAGRIFTSAEQTLTNYSLIIQDGKITGMVPTGKIKTEPTDHVIFTHTVTPGLIDCYTTAGLSGLWNIPADQDQDEPSSPNQAELRVIDGYNAAEPLLAFLRQNGITVTHTAPGRAVVLAGTSGVFRTDSKTAEDALSKAFAVVVNLGEVPKETFKGKGPQTRMGTAAVVRKAFADAQAYAAKKNPPKNAQHEALLPALSQKMPVIFTAHRADDIRTALRIAEEFQLKPVIALGTESFLMREELAQKKVPVIVHPSMQRAGDSMETANTLLANAALLKQAGVPILFSTAFEGYVPKNRNLRAEAAMAAANGLGQEAALRAITIDAAKFLGIDKQVGSLEVGKVADLVLYDGDPLEHTTHVLKTVMNGKIVYDREDYLKLPLDRRIMPIVGGGAGAGCCLGIW